MSEFDTLLEIVKKLENKVDHLTDVSKSQDLVLKILSNKINLIIEKLDIIINITNEDQVQALPKTEVAAVAPTKWVNSAPVVDVVAATIVSEPDEPLIVEEEDSFPDYESSSVDDVKTAIVQRVISANKKSLYLANVEIANKLTGDIVHKTRTNHSGKWQAVLSKGSYTITIRKKDAATQNDFFNSKEIYLDGTNSVLDLPDLIIK
jgi:hypothetical protein